MKKKDDMREPKTNNDIYIAIGEVAGTVEGINDRLDKLNGSVAKNIDKLAAQDVLNAQSTLIHQQILKDVSELQQQNKKTHDDRDAERSSIGRFWLGIIVSISTGVLIFIFKKLGVI